MNDKQKKSIADHFADIMEALFFATCAIAGVVAILLLLGWLILEK